MRSLALIGHRERIKEQDETMAVDREAQATKRQRTCVACGERAGKGQLHRIVRLADGSVRMDPSGRMPGRGAYVCSETCLAAAFKGGRLSRSLRAKLSQDDYDSIACDLARALHEARE